MLNDAMVFKELQGSNIAQGMMRPDATIDMLPADQL